MNIELRNKYVVISNCQKCQFVWLLMPNIAPNLMNNVGISVQWLHHTFFIKINKFFNVLFPKKSIVLNINYHLFIIIIHKYTIFLEKIRSILCYIHQNLNSNIYIYIFFNVEINYYNLWPKTWILILRCIITCFVFCVGFMSVSQYETKRRKTFEFDNIYILQTIKRLVRFYVSWFANSNN